jgi:predicted DNA-binding transcriptional regulator AlpA
MERIELTPTDRAELVNEITTALFNRLSELKELSQEDELIQIPEAMKILGRSRSTINNWRKEGFLKDQVINTRVYFKKSDVLNAGRNSRCAFNKNR